MTALPENPKSWRDIIQVHPAADMLPPISPDELRELGEDIKANGMQVPIVLFRNTPFAEYFLLDGRNRLDAMELVGLPTTRSRDSKHDITPLFDWPIWTAARKLDGAPRANDPVRIDPLSYVLSLNLHRRHLTVEQRREIAAALIKVDPSKSDRRIAAESGLNRTDVGIERKKLEQAGTVSISDTRIGKDGVKQPARKPSAPNPVPATPAPGLQGSKPAVAWDRKFERQRFLKVLQDAEWGLRYATSWIVDELPLSDRITLCRRWMTSLKVTIEALQSDFPADSAAPQPVVMPQITPERVAEIDLEIAGMPMIATEAPQSGAAELDVPCPIIEQAVQKGFTVRALGGGVFAAHNADGALVKQADYASLMHWLGKLTAPQGVVCERPKGCSYGGCKAEGRCLYAKPKPVVLKPVYSDAVLAERERQRDIEATICQREDRRCSWHGPGGCAAAGRCREPRREPKAEAAPPGTVVH